MTPTLLELALAIAILAIAWQLGVALAPVVFRQIRLLRREVDDAANAATDNHERDPRPPHDRVP